jgi:putative transcriptional regulator
MLNLTGYFLIAVKSDSFQDSFFSESVVYVCQHDDKGAFGIVVNQPSEMTLSLLLERVDIEKPEGMFDRPVFQGGPVQMERGFVLHPSVGEYESTLKINEQLCLTTSRDVLEAFSRGNGPEQVFISLGYSGWSAGQLEQELAKNWWLVVPGDPQIIFDQAVGDRYKSALALLGVSPERLSFAGRA